MLRNCSISSKTICGNGNGITFHVPNFLSISFSSHYVFPTYNCFGFFLFFYPYTNVVMFLIFGISQLSSFIAIQEGINEKMRMLGGWEYGLMSKKPALRTQGFGFGFPVPI